MAKILCVLYDDPVDGYPTSYARDGLPSLARYPDDSVRDIRFDAMLVAPRRVPRHIPAAFDASM